MHTISGPKGLKGPIGTAETFNWLGRQAVAVASGRSVWIGWRRDANSEFYTASACPTNHDPGRDECVYYGSLT